MTMLSIAVESRYTRIAIVLHWVIAAFIATNVVLALTVDLLPDDWIRPVIDTHKSIGITVLGLAILRVLWRVTHLPPPFPRRYPAWERGAAHVVHALLYLTIFALPLSGWLHDSAWKDASTHPMTLFGIVPWPRVGWVMDLDATLKEGWHDRFGALHAWCGYLLYGLFAVHVVGALKHQWFDDERELQRMLP